MLRWLRFFLLLAWVLLLIVLGGWIFSENTSAVNIRLFGFESGQQTLGLVVIFALAMGWCLGFLTTALAIGGSAFWRGRKLKATQRQLDSLKHKEVLPKA